MVASVEARAKRRYKEYLDKQIEADYDVIYKDIETRDYQDTHRATSPLKKAEDALEIAILLPCRLMRSLLQFSYIPQS